jgi:hypothetical protein
MAIEEMMPLQGGAFLALWNDRSARRDDYDVWHSREHVPERLTVPGISRATRYSGGEGRLPAYFTLYTLDDISVLDRPAYQQLMRNPTPWSASMRPDFSRFFRVPCNLTQSTGGGLGGWCVAALVPAPASTADVAELVAALAALAPVTAVHFGVTATTAAAVPFSVSQEDATSPYGVLIVEGFEGAGLYEAVSGLLRAWAPRLSIADATWYHLAFALNATSIDSIHPFSQPDPAAND